MSSPIATSMVRTKSTKLVEASGDSTNRQLTNQILFIDCNVKNYQTIATALVPGAEIVLLDSNQDGVVQINEYLAQRSEICNIHIASPSAPGCLSIGSSQLSLTTLDYYAWELQSWSIASLTLHVNHVDAGVDGATFLKHLGELMGATITLSTLPLG